MKHLHRKATAVVFAGKRLSDLGLVVAELDLWKFKVLAGASCWPPFLPQLLYRGNRNRSYAVLEISSKDSCCAKAYFRAFDSSGIECPGEEDGGNCP
jgi:hypothetical protein